MRGRVESVLFRSEVLKDNALGDPAERELLVYLPPGYDEQQHLRYPSVYVLSGYFGRGRMLLNDHPFEPNFAERVDRLIAAGMAPGIFVLPDCFTTYGGSQYVNSTATGRYEDYLLEEILPFIDASFRTIPAASSRGVTGKSSGGYGAVMLGMRRPDLFGAVACHSGDMYFEYCYKPDFPKLIQAAERAGGLEAWWERFQAKVRKDQADMEAANILGMAAAYSPDPSAPLRVQFPFDLYTGKLRDDVWARWLDYDPVYLVDRYAEALRSMQLLFLDCGLRDQFNLQYGARIFSGRLKALGIVHEHEEFDDTHSGISYRYDVSLPKLMMALT